MVDFGFHGDEVRRDPVENRELAVALVDRAPGKGGAGGCGENKNVSFEFEGRPFLIDKDGKMISIRFFEDGLKRWQRRW
jgi:hypothetical protein